MEVLQPDRAPLPITTLDERLELIAETGIDTTVVVPHSPAPWRPSKPKAFVKDVLARDDSGRGRSSSASTIASAGAPAATRSSSRALAGPARVSRPRRAGAHGRWRARSRRPEIRAALQRGDLPERRRGCSVARIRSRGEVVRGRRSRSHAGLSDGQRQDRPTAAGCPVGVYVCRLRWTARRTRPSSTSGCGRRSAKTSSPSRRMSSTSRAISTTNGSRWTSCAACATERKFPSVDELRQQIALDVAAARARPA